MNASQLLNAVLALPPDERRRVALAALESVDDPTGVVSLQEEWDAVWAAEVEARLDADETSVPFSTLLEELRARRA